MKVEKNGRSDIISESKEDEKTFGVASNMNIYNDNFDHLLEELSRIDLIICRGVEKYRTVQHDDIDDLRGLYISDDEVNEIIHASHSAFKNDASIDFELEEIKQISRKISRKKDESIKRGAQLRLHTLSQLFNLDPFEIDIILICLASELDLRYEKLYSYIHNDVTKKRPTVDLIMKLLSFSIGERFKARKYFSPDSVLINNFLIHLASEGTQGQLPLLSNSLKLDERVIDFLLGFDEIDPKLRNFSSIKRPTKIFNDLILTNDEKKTLIDIVKCQIHNKNSVMFLFHGPYGTGKKAVSEAICKELGRKMLVVDPEFLSNSGYFETLDIILREAILQNSALYFEGFDELLKDSDSGVSPTKLIQKLDRFPNWIFLSSNHSWEPRSILKNNVFVTYPFPIPSFTIRKQLWDIHLKNDSTPSNDLNVNALATKFNFSGGQIKDAIFTASNAAMTKSPVSPVLSMKELYQGCKAQSNQKLTTLARKIETHNGWEDIILPKDTNEQLKEVCGFIKYRGIVYNDWGFDRKLSMGKGLNILFSGPSGTGKTMAAEIIAKEVGLDLYKIDLSSVVSKYIGETEKNLKKIFKEAETSNAILLFDEADALFGKRSEVKDAHDRYANIETNYLLQKMEEHEGIVILASNFRKNIDEAFLRRLHFTIEFPFPDEKSREMIWRNIFPNQTPIGDGVDFNFLSKFKITGGNIKNIALSAAFLAAGDSSVVEMEHMIKTTKREFQKMGKLCNQSDFGIYYDLVK